MPNYTFEALALQVPAGHVLYLFLICSAYPTPLVSMFNRLRSHCSTELLLGAESYGFAIDIWSGGCVLAEMIAGDPVFKGEEIGMDQLVEIICVLGTITEEEMEDMGAVLPSLDDKVLASRLAERNILIRKLDLISVF